MMMGFESDGVFDGKFNPNESINNTLTSDNIFSTKYDPNDSMNNSFASSLGSFSSVTSTDVSNLDLSMYEGNCTCVNGTY